MATSQTTDANERLHKDEMELLYRAIETQLSSYDRKINGNDPEVAAIYRARSDKLKAVYQKLRTKGLDLR